MIMRTSSGLYLYKMDMIKVLMDTDLPEPVAPAIRNAIGAATGAYINELPLSPHTLFREFTDAGLINDSFAEDKQGKESK